FECYPRQLAPLLLAREREDAIRGLRLVLREFRVYSGYRRRPSYACGRPLCPPAFGNVAQAAESAGLPAALASRRQGKTTTIYFSEQRWAGPGSNPLKTRKSEYY